MDAKPSIEFKAGQHGLETHVTGNLFRSIALTLAAVAVGIAIHLRDGEYMFPSGSAFYPPIWFIGLAIASVFIAVRPPRWTRFFSRLNVEEIIQATILAGLLVQFALLIKSPPVGWNPWSDDLKDGSKENLQRFYLGATAAAGMTLVLLTIRTRLWVIPFILIVGIHGYLGYWTVRSCPEPNIDVWYFQKLGAQALLRGENPYTTRYPDIYAQKEGQESPTTEPATTEDAASNSQPAAVATAPASSTIAPSTSPATSPVTNPSVTAADDSGNRKVYGAGLSEGGQLTFGFPYPPLSLFLSTLGYKLAGDYRYAQATALPLAGLLLAFAIPFSTRRGNSTDLSVGSESDVAPWRTPSGMPLKGQKARSVEPIPLGRTAAIAVLLFLFTPRVFFVLGRGWTEPLVVLMLALTLFTACRVPKLLPIALGLFLASKQYLIFAVPLAWLLVPVGPGRGRRALVLIGGAVLVAAAVTLPMALRDFPAFYRSTFTAQLVAPFRTDALSWLVWFYERTGVQLGSWVAFLLAGVALIANLKWCPKNPAGFALGLAAVYLPFIAFNKQAFANYYLFVLATIGAALVLSVGSASADAKPRQT